MYGEGDIMRKSNYDVLPQRKKMVKLNTGGNARNAWIAYDSIPERFQKKIVEKIGAPYKKVRYIIWADYIKADFDAERYFKTYTLEPHCQRKNSWNIYIRQWC